jgi:hypothetical protein
VCFSKGDLDKVGSRLVFAQETVEPSPLVRCSRGLATWFFLFWKINLLLFFISFLIPYFYRFNNVNKR